MSGGADRCGFCSSEAHDRCPGGVRNGNGTIFLCRCGCPRSGVPHCTECWNQVADELTEQWHCVDTVACAERAEANLLANPLMVQIRSIQAAHSGPAKTTVAVGTTRPRHAREVAPAGEPRGICHCGCGDATKGGKFAMGHDARLRSNLAKIVATAGPANDVANALAELIGRGGVWEKAGLKALPYDRSGIAGPAREMAALPGFVLGRVVARIGAVIR